MILRVHGPHHRAAARIGLADADIESVVERTEGVTASFIKELLRALTESGEPLTSVTGAELARALDDLLDSTQGVTRALLGVPADQTATPAVVQETQRGGHGSVAWASPAVVSSAVFHGD